MMLIYTGNRKDIATASYIVEKILEHNYVSAWLESSEPVFDVRYTNVTNEVLADTIERNKFKKVCRVYAWVPFNPFTKAKASYVNSEMKINVKKIRNFESLCGSIAHELIGHHIEKVCRFHDKRSYNFNHGDNKRKPDTFPYWVGTVTKVFVKSLLEDNYDNPYKIIEYLEREHGSNS